MSRPLNMIVPPVGSTSLMIVRAERRLAAARLADEPERLAGLDREIDAVDGVDCADLRFSRPARIGKYLTRPSTRRISAPVPARSWSPRRLGVGAALIGASRRRRGHRTELRLGADQLLGEVARRQVTAPSICSQRRHVLAAAQRGPATGSSADGTRSRRAG